MNNQETAQWGFPLECRVRPAIYTASKTKHAEKWRSLRDDGHRIVSTWIDEAEPGQTADYSELANRCLAEIAEADYVLLYCESEEILKGAIIEAGMALALGKPVRCVGDCLSISAVFAAHPLWRAYQAIADAVAA
jgi:nucleoside 2-deoxyribosyltransferase